MKKRLLIFAPVAVIFVSLMFGSAFTDTKAVSAASKLHTLGLLQGDAADAGDTADFALDRAPTRAEAVTMLVRLLGKESEARGGDWATPFNDVPEWAKPYVGYAYANQLAFGVAGGKFGSGDNVTATQYLSLVLRALGYESGTDFEWDRAWELSDKLGITDGRYNDAAATFLRGDIVSISYDALSATQKGSDKTLCSALIEAGAFTESAARSVGLGAAVAPAPSQTPEMTGASEFEAAVFDLINREREKNGLDKLELNADLSGLARAYSMDMEQRGFFSHIDPEGNTPVDRISTDSIDFTYCAENIAHGQLTPEAVVNAWMRSDGHRRVILGGKSKQIGIGFYDYYWTADFIG